MEPFSDSSDFKKWLEGTDWDALIANIDVFTLINNIKSQNNFYNEMAIKNQDLKLNNVNLKNYIEWFNKNQLTKITLKKVNKQENTAKTLMKTLAAFYLSIDINKKSQMEFLKKIKGSKLLKNKISSDFKNLESLDLVFKAVWTGRFLN